MMGSRGGPGGSFDCLCSRLHTRRHANVATVAVAIRVLVLIISERARSIMKWKWRQT